MYRARLRGLSVALLLCGVIGYGCDDGVEADELGVGAQCASNADCADGQTCLGFKGGYCGVGDCERDADCPEASACVAHSDGKNYCFRLCADKQECNANRDPDNEANCSSSFTFSDGKKNGKVCLPPS